MRALDALGEFTPLDTVAGPLSRAVRRLPLGPLRDVLHGRWLGHPLHPALVQVPVGAWMSAAVLDVVPGAERGARTLVGLGVLSALPAAWSGWVDWAEQHEAQQRTGVVHAGANVLAIGLFAGSWAARGRGRTGLGRALTRAGLTSASLGAMIGGHLAYRQSAGANKAEPVPHLLEPRWYGMGPLDEYPAGEPVRRMLGEVPLLVVRMTEDEAYVLGDRCSHDSGPLSEGEVRDGCVECPWDGSLFRLSDGWNVHGPATAPQPSFEAGFDGDGSLRVRLPRAD
ncbi:Rieske (2Fe-2S) protein [Streptomyces sp. HNM0574]|uniref:Rieske (2Fe-2S) protein n=1 Tax=Streptomyces sp. HNM0574 TaxID=2714954 RepID=UPI0032175BDF